MATVDVLALLSAVLMGVALLAVIFLLPRK